MRDYQGQQRGPSSGRDVDLEDVVDPDRQKSGSAVHQSAVHSAIGFGKVLQPVRPFKFDSGFKARAEQWNFENKDSCDVVVRSLTRAALCPLTLSFTSTWKA